MPVKFYAHTPVDDLGERGALFEVARRLLDRYAGADAPSFTLVANVVPDRVPAWREYELTQLDALLLGERFVAILEVKNIARPVKGEEGTRWWIIKSDNRRDHDDVKSGNQRNPYIQLKHARYQWTNFLREETRSLVSEGQLSPFDWDKLSGRILFYPSLHPESELFDPPKWLRFISPREIVDDAAANTAGFQLTPELMRGMAEDVLQARVWELTRTIRRRLGVLTVFRPNSSLYDTYPIYAHSQMTIGRRSDNDIPVDVGYSRTSRRHARIVADEETITLYDEDSRHGTYVNDRRVPRESGQHIQAGALIRLGQGKREEMNQTALMILQQPPSSLEQTPGETV